MKTLAIPAVFLLLALPLQAFANCCIDLHQQMHHGTPTPVTISCSMAAPPESVALEKPRGSSGVPLTTVVAVNFELPSDPVQAQYVPMTFSPHLPSLLVVLRI